MAKEGVASKFGIANHYVLVNFLTFHMRLLALVIPFLSVWVLFACQPGLPSNGQGAVSNGQSQNETTHSEYVRVVLNPTLAPKFRARAGWAYEAYPDVSTDDIYADMAGMRAAGANSIWLGHNNPGEVDIRKAEPGLSYAVFYAIESESGDKRQQALSMANGVRRALDCARRVGLRVVLPIGYQIMMGESWNKAYPEALRRTFDGSELRIFFSGPTASPYSLQYRSDITRYYGWIDREWVRPYRDVIEMLSIADEPLGGDYSSHAKEAFEVEYGSKMDDIPAVDRWKIGQFQAGVISDYARWSANTWQKLDPDVPVTISFDGGVARHHPGLPEIERLFTETPDNFVLTFDAYLHDDLPTKPVVETEIAELKLLLTTLGRYSKVYHKPIALWAGANSWGLAQESSSPRDIIDAVDNIFQLIDLPARAGGDVRGVYAWNYNLKGQGIRNFDKPTTYNAFQMEATVNKSFLPLRMRLESPKTQALQTVVVVSPRELYDKVESRHSSDLPPEWFDIEDIATMNRDRLAAVLSPGPALDASTDSEVFQVIVNSRDVDVYLKTFLSERFKEGKVIMARKAVASQLGAPLRLWEGKRDEVPSVGGSIYVLEGE